MYCASEKLGNKPKYLKIALLVIAGIAVQGWMVLLLWNWLMPAIFVGAQRVDCWQALGILLLCKTLLIRGGGQRFWREPCQRWEGMTPEERQQMRDRFKSHIGHRYSLKS